MALLRAREAVMREFRAALRRHGLTEQQWRVLRALTARDEMEILALADRILVLYEGRITAEFARGAVTEGELGLKMGGS